MREKTNVTKAEKLLLGITAVFLCVLAGLYVYDTRSAGEEDTVAVTTEAEVPQEDLTPDFTPLDLNTATAAELTELPGIGEKLAERIVAYREANGPFTSRKQLLKVPKLGPKAFEQCAGFLRVPESKNVLDNTRVHPESYGAAKELLKLCGFREDDVKNGSLSGLADKVAALGEESVAQQIGVGVPTLQDIVKELLKPGRDPRDELPPPLLRTDILELKAIAPEIYIPFIADHFQKRKRHIEIENIEKVYRLFKGHTFYIQKTFNEAFADTPKGKECTLEIIKTAIDNLVAYNDTIFREILSNIPEKQKELLYAIAKVGEAENVTSAKFIKRYSLTSASSVQSATKKLLEKDIITEIKIGRAHV